VSRSRLVTSAEFKVNRRTAESIRRRWRICAARRTTEVIPSNIDQQNFRAKMERTTCFSVWGADGIVTDDMYQDSHSSSRQTADSVRFSEKDREDAARLLALIAGEERARRIRLLQSTTEIARAILHDRKRRSRIFNAGMFGEPAWELLLSLYVMDQDGPRLTIGRLIESTECPPTTALRWLQYLQDQDLIVRREHPGDARTAFVSLTNKAREALDLYLSDSLTTR